MPHFSAEMMKRLNSPLDRPASFKARWVAGPLEVDLGPGGKETLHIGDVVTIFELDGVGPAADFVIHTPGGAGLCCGHFEVGPLDSAGGALREREG